MPHSGSIAISFPGGLHVDAQVGGFVVKTDQPAASGGEGTAPSPFDLFLASLGTCAGFYALRFCQERYIPTEGLSLVLRAERDPLFKRVAKVRLELTLPDGFPEKYRVAVQRAMEQCSVKRHVQEAPRFEVVTVERPARVEAEAVLV